MDRDDSLDQELPDEHKNYSQDDEADVLSEYTQQGKSGLLGQIKDFVNFFTDGIDDQIKPQWCLIKSTNKYKLIWDLILLCLLVFISMAVPYRIAFVDFEPYSWILTYWIIDILFFIDIILTFMTST